MGYALFYIMMISFFYCLQIVTLVKFNFKILLKMICFE